MTRTFSRSERYVQVEKLLLASRTPLSQAEIARRCGVSPSTISRMVQSMVDSGIPLRTDERGWLYVEHTAYISTLKLKLHEAVALFLSARLLARYSDKPNAHTVEAIEKLGVSLQQVMPMLGKHMSTTAISLRGQLPKQVGVHQRVLEKLTEAWAAGRKVHIWYRPLKARRAFQHTFAPYLLEPSGIGYSVYAIGLAEPPGQMRSRKLERIERIMITDEPFYVPGEFDPNKLLSGAWSIWFDEEDQPTTVQLRFSGEHTIRRMRETFWHPSQRIEEDAEGRLIWTADIDEPQEMLPWIRGWEGGTCEVLAPMELRERIMGEASRLARLYGLERTDLKDRRQAFKDIFGE